MQFENSALDQGSLIICEIRHVGIAWLIGNGRPEDGRFCFSCPLGEAFPAALEPNGPVDMVEAAACLVSRNAPAGERHFCGCKVGR